MTTTARARTGVDIFATVKPIPSAPFHRKCAVCGMRALGSDVCGYCREDLPGLLASLTQQQETIIERMTQQRIDLGLHISCASDEEQARYAKMCELRNAGTLEDKHYRAAQGLQTPLGAIVRADAKVSEAWRDVEALNALERKIAAVELAIAGLKESA